MKKTSRLLALTGLCSILAITPARSAVNWHFQIPATPGARYEFAKEGLATDSAGNTYAIGYNNLGAAEGAEAIIFKRNLAGALVATGIFHPLTGDSYWYTSVSVDVAAATLVVTGTHLNAASGALSGSLRVLMP